MPYPRPRRAAALVAAVPVLALALLALAGAPRPAAGQSFTRITDATNPIVSDPGTTATFTGASWIDYDGDGLPDLYVCRVGLYHNLGGGKFEKVPSVQGPALLPQLASTWADYDNDGDPDLFISGSGGPNNPGNGSLLFRNDGAPGSAAGPFTRVFGGDLADSLHNGGWSAAFGDYDNDGRVDIAVAGLTNFCLGGSNHLLHNLGGDVFVRDSTTQVDDFLAPFTVPTWSDFDQDGDMDLFIGSGPGTGALGPDYCFRNSTIGPPGATRLDRLVGSPYTDNRDGQVWNWIDYDNDGDLDVYITSYGGFVGQPNELWRNDGSTFVKLAAAAVGAIVGDKGLSLSSCWADFDNDGDLDCLVTNAQSASRFYRNDVDSTGQFTSLTIGLSRGGLTTDPATHSTACAADYDRDGRVDLFVEAAGTSKNLYRNTTANGFHWVEFRLVGGPSNRSAIGARIHVRAMIKGQPRWQMREISAQNTFNGQNDLVAHFGLREAQVIDSIRIEWPSGRVEEAGGAAVDRLYTIVEGSLGATPTRIHLAASRVTEAGAVRLTYAGTLDPDARATVERSDDGVAWSALGTLGTATDGLWIYEDATVEPGRRYAYRLAFANADGTAAGVTDAAWVDVPAGALAFGFARVPANPLAIGAAAQFTVGMGAGSPGSDARLELVSASGRIAWTRALTAPPGAPSLTLDVPTGQLAPGVYWARLVQGAHQQSRKLVLVR